ncbi:hypothetical protein AaE_014283 [Aphanomyces astaci]|uniref:Uncharacterized protein n=1 Tax=Aphanomyces astaci TaxID=112090 RepID=A0A6A4Z756_APHAT|nr:hypothetical protein AaE_014283 [Aphanomyces astaci]
MYFNDNARADTLWCCLAASHTLAICLHVRIHLFVVVVIFVVCDYFRLEIVNYTGMYLDHANAFATSNYLDNIITQPTKASMNVWAFHENVTTDYKLILNEYTYLWVAAGLCQVYVVLEKVARTLAASQYLPHPHRRRCSLKRLNVVQPSSGSPVNMLRKKTGMWS